MLHVVYWYIWRVKLHSKAAKKLRVHKCASSTHKLGDCLCSAAALTATLAQYRAMELLDLAKVVLPFLHERVAAQGTHFSTATFRVVDATASTILALGRGTSATQTAQGGVGHQGAPTPATGWYGSPS